jgi:photosystem II stability/assembly factor-like uncharacterized protein
MAVSPGDADRVFAATAPSSERRGEVFRTTDGGLAWTLVTGSLPDRYIVDIAFSPASPGQVFITVSGFGTSHLYRTDDGGSTWTDVGSGLPDVPTSAVAVDPVYPNLVYVGNDLGVYISTNGGSSWLSFNEGLPSAVLVMDLSICPLDRLLRAVTHGNGVFERSLLDPSTVDDPGAVVPRSPSLGRNYPNPFNAYTSIPLDLPESAFVTVRIFTLQGHPVRSLAARRYPAGRFILTWDGRDSQGSPVPSGTYLIRMTADGHKAAIRVLLVR